MPHAARVSFAARSCHSRSELDILGLGTRHPRPELVTFGPNSTSSGSEFVILALNSSSSGLTRGPTMRPAASLHFTRSVADLLKVNRSKILSLFAGCPLASLIAAPNYPGAFGEGRRSRS